MEAPPEICGAIRYVNRFRLADLIITGRGGGSIEDLWAFNDERVAREIFRSEIPVISAVGHEPDVTISDYVADLRAATPSNAAELAVPDQMELRQTIDSLQSRMKQALVRQLKLSRQRLESLQNKRVLQNPVNYLEDRKILVEYQQKQLHNGIRQILAVKKQQLVRLSAGLDAMSPLKVLARGYSMTKDEGGHVLSDWNTVLVGDRIHITLSSGSAAAIVETIGGEECVNTSDI